MFATHYFYILVDIFIFGVTQYSYQTLLTSCITNLITITFFRFYLSFLIMFRCYSPNSASKRCLEPFFCICLFQVRFLFLLSITLLSLSLFPTRTVYIRISISESSLLQPEFSSPKSSLFTILLPKRHLFGSDVQTFCSAFGARSPGSSVPSAVGLGPQAFRMGRRVSLQRS